MRITFCLAVLALSFTLFATHCDFAFAQTSTGSADINLEGLGTLDEAGAVDIGESLIAPNSPLYFLKALREKIEVSFASNAQTKAIIQLEFAQRRLREVRTLVKIKNQDLIPPTLERYKLSLAEALGMTSQDEELKVKLGEAIARHLDVLQRVYDAIGNPAAKRAVLSAIERAEAHNRTLLKTLSLAPQQKLIRKIALRQALACKFIARESTSSGLNAVERSELSERVKQCSQDVNEKLKDELQEIREKRMELEIEGKRPVSTPSAVQ